MGMTKTELKQNITKINKLLRSDSYEAGIELIKTLDDPEITKATLKEVLKHPDYDKIDAGIELAVSLEETKIFETLLDGCKSDLSTSLSYGESYLNDWLKSTIIIIKFTEIKYYKNNNSIKIIIIIKIKKMEEK